MKYSGEKVLLWLPPKAARQETWQPLSQPYRAVPAFIKGGIIAYANEVKENLLHVKTETLEAHGAVSEETVTEMVYGAMQALSTDYAIATLGIAGPAGGTPDKPVGTIWVAAGNKSKVITAKLTEDDGREKNIQAATKKALQLLLELCQEQENEA